MFAPFLFWNNDSPSISSVDKYAAGGQVAGALATFFTLLDIIKDNLNRNKDESDRKNREIVALWQSNMPIIEFDIEDEEWDLGGDPIYHNRFLIKCRNNTAFDISYILTKLNGDLVLEAKI